MSDRTPVCPKCSSRYAYQDQLLWICPECAHEWSLNAEAEAEEAATEEFLDANGVQQEPGDIVRLIGDLKLGNGTINSATRAKSIRHLDEPVNGLIISCRIDGFGSVYLKCSVVS